jgi:hypothetical protein
VTPSTELIGNELGVQIVGDRDIVVSSVPKANFSITYRKDGLAPLLQAVDGIGRSSEPARVRFWAEAWKAAHRRAVAMGWLAS